MFADVPPAPTTQVVVVRAERWRSQRATVRRWQFTGGAWQRVGPAVPAWLGSNGMARGNLRQQNSGQTPAGVFTLPQGFGASSGQAVRLPYTRITPHSYWPYDPRDPRTYNVLQTQRTPGAQWRNDGEWSEHLASYGRAYRYAVVIGYNLPGSTYRHRSGEWRTRTPARTDKGGGIFLHVSRGRPTAGCVAITARQMRATLRWLDPAASPRIVIGPRQTTRGWQRSLADSGP